MEEINLKEFWDYYTRYIIKIICVVVICAIGAFVYTKFLKTPMYSTSTTIVLAKSDQGNTTNDTITQTDLSINQKLVSTYRQILKSKLVVQQVIDDLDLDVDYSSLSKRIDVQSIEDTEILKVTVTDESAEDATEIANKLSKVFGDEVSKIYKINNVSIIDTAEVPTEPSNINTIKNVVIVSLIGFVVSSGIVFIIFYFDDIIRDTETLEKESGLPILSKIFKDNSNIELIVNEKPNAAASEGIRNLRTSLQFSSVDEKLKTILVTSSVPSDGKSFISANLAVSFAQAGKRTLLIDCDLRKGRQHKIFNISGNEGLSNLLIEDVKNCSNYIFKTKVNNLFLMPRGTFPPNPSELLNSKKNRLLIETLQKHFEIIILDGAPVSGLSDSLILSSLVDKTILVSSINHTPKTELSNARKALAGVSANIAGVVANRVVAKKGGSGSYYYYYGYDDNGEKSKSKKTK